MSADSLAGHDLTLELSPEMVQTILQKYFEETMFSHCLNTPKVTDVSGNISLATSIATLRVRVQFEPDPEDDDA